MSYPSGVRTRHDLPPSWDGLPVVWAGWQAPLPMFLCPPPRVPECCTWCGVIGPALTNRGTLRDRTVGALQPRLRALFAFRCPDCHHDTVWDVRYDTWWDLDDSDYGDAGSVVVGQISLFDDWGADG